MTFTFRRKLSPQPLLAQRPFELLCLTVGLVLIVHAGHLPWWLSGSLALVLLWRLKQRRQQVGAAPMWVKLPLIALLVAALVLSYGNLFGREPGAALIVGMLVLKLLESERERDARVGAAFACFALMSALLLDQSLLTTLIVALGLLPALATLHALQPARVSRSFARELLPALRLLAVALPLALLAFVLVPRLSSPLWGAPNAPTARTGLSDRMSPGDFTELLTDDRPAMRVDFDHTLPTPAQRYFRAYVLWRYDGRNWSGLDRRRGFAPVALDAQDSVSYRISLEPNQQRVLPALDVPLAAPEGARLLADREVLADKPTDTTRNYALRSTLRYRFQPNLDETSRRLGLQLPSGFNPRALALGRQWREQFGNDDAIIQAAVALFHDGGFSYTLAPPALGRDAMDDFLFDTHQGFCEHYASAFTVLMRAAGIPARVVTGYQGGYWNNLGNYLLVRQSDAHAWVELWLAGRGWVRFDPTAAVRPQRILGATAAVDQEGWSARDWLREWRNRWDVVNRWWDQGVIGFDALRQRGLLTPFGISEVDSSTLAALLAASGGLFGALGLAWALRRRGKRDRLRECMRQIERRLARAGVERRRGEGPQHYLQRAARALPTQRHQIEKLMANYLEASYAQDIPAPESLLALRRQLRDVRPRRVYKEH
jgi:transglutaminase-like putative cysteine protease